MRINQIPRLSAALALALFAGVLTGCDKGNAKKITDNTYDPVAQSLGADNMSVKNPGNAESEK